MRPVSALLCGIVLGFSAFAQNDRGIITGEVWDSANAVVPNAVIVAQNVENGTEAKTVSSATGNYTIPSLPAGHYRLIVEVTGFKRFVQENIEVAVAQTNRVDVHLQVGATTDTVTVNAEAPVLKTESGEQSTIVATDRINQLPLNFGGGGGSNGTIRNPFMFNILSPGVASSGNDTAQINGLPSGSFRVQVEGQDTTSQNDPNWTSTVSHASVDMIQEFSLQTSNFAAEFSQVAGGFYNFTTKSGTNDFHGTAYEYLTNEALDAYRPFTYTNPRSRKNDFGGTIGGPVRIPKLYNGKNKTFFFFSEEIYRNKSYANGSTFLSLPTAAMRAGDFSAKTILVGNQIGTDPSGAPILNGGIYDPASAHPLANGQIVTTMFPGNIIPQSRFDPVAAKIQALIPAPTNGNPTNNFAQQYVSPFNQQIPAIKIDEILPDSSRLSFYFNKQYTNQLTSPDGLPYPLSAVRVQAIYGTVPRLNYDKSVTPTLLLHAGVGYQRFHNPDSSPPQSLQYDAAGQLGFVGSATNPSGFPRINGLSFSLGPSNANSYFDGTFTSVLSATWVHGNHTYKLGGEFRLNSWTDRNSRGSQGILAFSQNQTGLPYAQTTTFNLNGVSGSIGNAYASFLLGQADSASVNAVQDPQLRKQAWGLYLQDTWKITPKLTLDYGLRWDLETEGHEIHYRWSMFGPTIPNPTVNNVPGAYVYQGYGPGRCNCTFTYPYPYAIGPRLGVAYQLDSKTVLRGGFGVSYGAPATYAYITNAAIVGVGFNQLNFTNTATGFGTPAVTLQGGLQYNHAALYDASLNPGLQPTSPNSLATFNFYIDPNGARPARIPQWSIGLQREVLRGLVVEGNYVGNRGAWEQGGTNLDGGLNIPNPAVFAKYGIDPTTAAGQATLTAQIGSAAGKASGVPLPYPTFPLTATVLQALRPFPQVAGPSSANGGVTVDWAPLADNWYNSLQVKVTKRYEKGLSIISAFTWSKAESNPGNNNAINNVFNRSIQKSITSFNQPTIFSIGYSYELQKYTSNRFLNAVIKGWTVGGLLVYSSGLPIASPTSSNNMAGWYGQNTLENRVPGQPLYLENPSCHCIDPTQQFILNPAAWANPAPGQWGTAAPYYSDFRYSRRPQESMNLGRTFRIKERKSLEIRAEFFNVFNRIYLNNPTVTGPQGAQTCTNGPANPTTHTCNPGGTTVSGFGYINFSSVQTQPRNGQLVARFTF